MPSYVSPRDYIRQMEEKCREIEKEKERLKAEHQSYLDDAQAIDQKYEQTLQEMGAYLLPEVTEEALQKLSQQLGDPQIALLKAKMDKAIANSAKQAEELEQHPEIRRYNLVHSELQSEIDLLEPSTQREFEKIKFWQQSEHYQYLADAGYFKPNYRPSLWQRFKNWKHASYLMEELERPVVSCDQNGHFQLKNVYDVDGEMLYPRDGSPSRWKLVQLYHFKDAKELKAEHQRTCIDGMEAWETLHEMKNHLQQMEQRKKKLEALRNAPETELSNLYVELHERIAEQVEHNGEMLLQGTLGRDKFFVAYLKKLSALPKQSSYLRELAARRIAPAISDLSEIQEKTREKIVRTESKVARGKISRLEPHKIQKDVTFDQAKWSKKRGSITHLRQTIVTFEHYDRGSLVGDFLWWDLMTRAARGDDLMEVRDFHKNHPGWDYRNHSSHHDAIDMAASDLAYRDRDSDADFS